jgi:CubicO group peptidase (beta-lactamase class C family)
LADHQKVLQGIEKIIQREFDKLSAPGIAIGITNSRETLSVKTYGLVEINAPSPVTPQTLFQIGSISKAFTSIVLLLLSEEGRVDLHAPLVEYLPWFKIESDFPPITLYHLMSHTAGIITGNDTHTSPFLEVWNLRNTRATAAPGETFHYSNTGYKALGLVLETLLGEELAAVLSQRVLTPLGMHETEPVITNSIRPLLAVGYQPYYDDRPLPRGGRLSPATWFENDTADGSICSNAGDMCRYLRFLLKGGEGLISRESFQQLTAPVIASDDKLHGEHYGLGLFTSQLDGHHIIGHSGGMVGYTADLLADTDADLGVVVLTSGPADPESISRFILKALRSSAEGADSLPEFGGHPEESPAEDYTGCYHCADKELILVSHQGRLSLNHGTLRIPLEYLDVDRYLVPYKDLEGFPLQFNRSGSSEGQEKAPVVELLHGSDCYQRSGFTNASAPVPPEEWGAYQGHYRAYNPWLSNFRILLQKGSLVLITDHHSDAEPLQQIAPGRFQVGPEPTSPEFIQFDLVINGKAQQANLSGSLYSRTFTP